VEAALAHTDWYARHVHGAPQLKRIDPHHLTYARRGLVAAGLIVEDAAILNGRSVSAYVDASASARRDHTRTTRLAAAKRRQYRRYLTWTGDPSSCGAILERQVQATLDALRGYDILLDRAKHGHVSRLDGAKVAGGPLDHAGRLVVDPDAYPPQLVGFCVEDKNLRSVLYPAAHEVWDLLVKAGDFPSRVPVLITAHAHYTLTVFFKAIGAVVYQSGYQWFAPDPTIASRDFSTVTAALGLRDARQLLHPDTPSSAVGAFFTKVLRATPTRESQPLIVRSVERWSRAATVCRDYAELRDDRLDPEKRVAAFQNVLEKLDEVGIDVEPLRAEHRHTEADDAEPDWEPDVTLRKDED